MANKLRKVNENRRKATINFLLRFCDKPNPRGLSPLKGIPRPERKLTVCPNCKMVQSPNNHCIKCNNPLTNQD